MIFARAPTSRSRSEPDAAATGPAAPAALHEDNTPVRTKSRRVQPSRIIIGPLKSSSRRWFNRWCECLSGPGDGGIHLADGRDDIVHVAAGVARVERDAREPPVD